MPPILFILDQHVLFLSLPSCIFFGHLRSIIWLEKSYQVITVSLNPLPMVLASHASTKSSFPYHSLVCTPDCVKSSICILLISLWMIFMNVSVLISLSWSTDRKKNPLLSLPKREPIKKAHFSLSAVLRTLALHFSTPKVKSTPPNDFDAASVHHLSIR